MRLLLGECRVLIGTFVRFGGNRLGTTVLLMLAGGVLEGVGLAMLVPVFSVLAPGAGGRWQSAVLGWLVRAGLNGQKEQLFGVLAAFCVLVVLRALVLAKRDRMVSDLTLGFGDHCRLAVVGDLAHARWASLARLRHARIGHILSSEVGRAAYTCSILLYVMMAGIMLGVQAALVVWLSPAMAILMAASAGLGLATLVPLSRRAALHGKSASRFAFRIAGEASQFLGGLKIAVAHGMADAFVAQIAAESAGLRVEQEAQDRYQSRFAIVSASIASMIGAAMIGGAVILGVPTISLLAALMVLARMNGPVRSLQLSAQQFFGILPAFTALSELRADLGEPVALALSGSAYPFRGDIHFEKVSFGYPGAAAAVFAGLELAIPAGAMVGLAGPSGTGKTTLLDLLTGLLEPDAGRIVIGGEALGPATMAAWRARLAYVPQDSYLANDTIRRNLTWNADPRPDAELWRALALAGAAELVATMPKGLDTRADERGTRLSGGERQRIAIARALLRAPELLILDEATNAIDLETEQGVITRVRGALPDATILVVAHREETLRACDQVIALADAHRRQPRRSSPPLSAQDAPDSPSPPVRPRPARHAPPSSSP